ncbi:MAG: metal-dependent hydrolase [Firmicutes bacterium]|nr:metal-dependent hydrolase [Bacillota bacterium]
MEAVTQLLAALVLARAALKRLAADSAWALAALALLLDADLLSPRFGAAAYLEWRRTATHSLAGAATVAIAVAVLFWLSGRWSRRPVRLWAALAACLTGAGVHLVVALLDAHGAQLLWPFRRDWYAWDLLEPMDPWVLVLLAGGLLLPALFGLVSEEIGARRPQRSSSPGALLALLLVAGYCGSRAVLHERARQMLDARLYDGAAPLALGVFPASASPLLWRGVVETETTLEVFDVRVGVEATLRARSTHYKPEPSPVLEAARSTEAVQRFLLFARFPLARIVRQVEGYRVEIHDLRFEPSPTVPVPMAVVETDETLRVTMQRIEFARTP